MGVSVIQIQHDIILETLKKITKGDVRNLPPPPFLPKARNAPGDDNDDGDGDGDDD